MLGSQPNRRPPRRRRSCTVCWRGAEGTDAAADHARSACAPGVAQGGGAEGRNCFVPNVHGGRLSADSVQWLLAKHAQVAGESCPSLKSKRLSPASSTLALLVETTVRRITVAVTSPAGCPCRRWPRTSPRLEAAVAGDSARAVASLDAASGPDRQGEDEIGAAIALGAEDTVETDLARSAKRDGGAADCGRR